MPKTKMKKNKGKVGRKKQERFGGAKITVSFSVIVMVSIAVAAGYIREVFSYAAAVILHEFSHATVAARLGYTLNTLKIMPYGAALTGQFEGARAKDEVLIAIAGPLSNLIFAVIFVAVWWLVPSLFYYTEIYVTANIFTALINMLPLFPLDGGRATLALVSAKIPREKAYKVMRIVGFVLSLIGIACAVVNFKRLNFSYFTFLIFVFVFALIPDKRSKYRRLYEMSYRMEKVKSGLSVREIMISENTEIGACLRLLSGNYYARFTVTDSSLKKVGEFDESALEGYIARFPLSTSVSEVLKKFRG